LGWSTSLKPFNYVPTEFGGTEYMGRGWHKYISSYVPKFDNYLSLIIPGVTPSFDDIFASTKPILVWMHNTPQQFDKDKLAVIKDSRFLDKVKYFIVPSEEHKKLILLEIPIDPERIYVIPNALEPLSYDPSKFNKPEKIRVIHTSSMDRGLDVLINAIPLIDEDFSVEVYNNFYPDFQENFDADKRIKFFGKTPKMTVRDAIESSHIHAYPSTYPETFCMSQVEAMSGGLLCVTSDIGALPEVSAGKTVIYPYVEDRSEHAKVFAKELTKAIKKIKEATWNPTDQIEYVNNKYCWEAIRKEWIKFHELL
jgi:glycosyltransferase involved in cell wall biosynthesis